MQERRRVHRGRTYLGGQVAFNDRCSVMDCLIRNMSRNGAKLVFDSTLVIPSEFDVMVRRGGESRRASIVWRAEWEMGVTFARVERDGAPSIEAARRVNALEAERRMLERRVAQLSEPM